MNMLNEEQTLTVDAWRAELATLADDGEWPEMNDEIIRLSQEPVPDGVMPDRWDYLKRFPLIGAAIIKYSAFYHSEYGAANTLWSYAHRMSNACEWHIHMANMAKKSLLAVNDEVVVRSIQFAQSGRSLYGVGEDPSFEKGLEWIERGLNSPTVA